MGRAFRGLRQLAPRAALERRASERYAAAHQGDAVPAGGARRLDQPQIGVRAHRRLSDPESAGTAATANLDRAAGDGPGGPTFTVSLGGISDTLLTNI